MATSDSQRSLQLCPMVTTINNQKRFQSSMDNKLRFQPCPIDNRSAPSIYKLFVIFILARVISVAKFS